MTPTERRRPITRRKRLAHLGIGGVLAAVAGAQAGAILADSHHEAPEPATVSDPPTLSDTVALTEAVPHRWVSPQSRHRVRPRQTSAAADISPVWTALAACESGGNWRDTSGLYDGGLQFLDSTWLEYGGGTYAAHAYDATEAEQVDVARKLLDADGPHPWPQCGPKVGLARGD